MKTKKIKSPLKNKKLPKRDKTTIRFLSDEQKEIIYEYDRFVEKKILDHAVSKRKTPKPKLNDFYSQALIRGIKYELMDNKIDEIVNITVEAVSKVLNQKNREERERQNLQTVYLASRVEYLTSLINYIIPILGTLAPEYFDSSVDEKTGSIKNIFLNAPVGFENLEKELLQKWQNKIKKDSAIEKTQKALFEK